MRYLLDTHLLLCATIEPEKLTASVRNILSSSDNELIFSAVSIWEVAIKFAKSPAGSGFPDPRVLYTALFDAGYTELPIRVSHAAAISDLPDIHRDPFDRMLVAQAQTEGTMLLTHDRKLSRYPGPIRLV